MGESLEARGSAGLVDPAVNSKRPGPEVKDEGQHQHCHGPPLHRGRHCYGSLWCLLAYQAKHMMASRPPQDHSTC